MNISDEVKAEEDARLGQSHHDTVVVYHRSSPQSFCDDGFAAAFAAWLHFKETALYLPGLYGEVSISLEYFRDKAVFFLDFSYPIEIMDEIAQVSRQLTVLDHHRWVIEAAGNRQAFIHSSVAHSGAVLAWHYFHPDKALPLLFCHIEDHDLWRHQMPDTFSFIQRLHLEAYTFSHWSTLLAQLENKTQLEYLRFIEEGNLLCRQIQHQCDALIPQAFSVTLNGVQGLAVNGTRALVGELGSRLSAAGGTYAAIFYFSGDGKIDVSLRTDHEDIDVSQIARYYGGGGHPGAAGFQTEAIELFMPPKKS